MKAAIVAVLLAVSASAQNQSPIAAAESACGPRNVKFDVKQGTPDRLICLQRFASQEVVAVGTNLEKRRSQEIATGELIFAL